jgi:predicted MFS family arabinose efflux permease
VSSSPASQLFEPRERSLAIGIWSGVSGLALAAGPLIGGSLVEHVGWQAVLLVKPPGALVAIALALATTSNASTTVATERRLDLPGIALLTVGAGALMLALVDFAGKHPKAASIVALLVIASGALGAFVRVQRRSPAPLLRLELFRSPTSAIGNVVMFATYALVVAQFFYITLFLQNGAGLSPIDTGVRLLPVTISVAVTAPLAGRLMNRVGPRPLVTTGLLMTAAALGLLRAELVDDGGSVLTGCSLALLGAGIGLVFAAVNAAGLRAVDRAYAGAAAGTLAMARHLGLTFGVGLIAAAAGASARAGEGARGGAGAGRDPPSRLNETNPDPLCAPAGCSGAPRSSRAARPRSSAK